MTLANGRMKSSLAVPGIGSLAHENAQLRAQNTRLIDYQHEQAAKIAQLEAELARNRETILAQAQRILELEAQLSALTTHHIIDREPLYIIDELVTIDEPAERLQ